VTFTNADADTQEPPRKRSYTLIWRALVHGRNVNVPHARYVVYSASQSTHYLVVLDKASSQKYYTFTVTGSGLAGKISALTLDSSPPPMRSRPHYSEERRTSPTGSPYYRRRELLPRMPWPT